MTVTPFPSRLAPAPLEDAIAVHVTHASAAVSATLYELATREKKKIIAALHMDHGDFSAQLDAPDCMEIIKIRSEDCLTFTGAPPDCVKNRVIETYPDYAYLHPCFESFRSVFHLYYDTITPEPISHIIDILQKDECAAAFFHLRAFCSDLPRFGSETDAYYAFYLLGYGLNEQAAPNFFPALPASLAYAFLSKSALSRLKFERDEQVFIAHKENIPYIPASVFAPASCAIRCSDKTADLAGFLGAESFYHARYTPPKVADPAFLHRVRAENEAFAQDLLHHAGKFNIQSALQKASAAQPALTGAGKNRRQAKK